MSSISHKGNDLHLITWDNYLCNTVDSVRTLLRSTSVAYDTTLTTKLTPEVMSVSVYFLFVTCDGLNQKEREKTRAKTRSH